MNLDIKFLFSFHHSFGWRIISIEWSGTYLLNFIRHCLSEYFINLQCTNEFQVAFLQRKQRKWCEKKFVSINVHVHFVPLIFISIQFILLLDYFVRNLKFELLNWNLIFFQKKKRNLIDPRTWCLYSSL